mgnify:CR=1 FL=1
MGFDEHYADKFNLNDDELYGFKIGFNEGAASRQQEFDNLQHNVDKLQIEVGELQNDLIKAAEGQMKLFEHNNELQNLIDEALDFLHASNHYNEYYVSQAIKILKGELK